MVNRMVFPEPKLQEWIQVESKQHSTRAGDFTTTIIRISPVSAVDWSNRIINQCVDHLDFGQLSPILNWQKRIRSDHLPLLQEWVEQDRDHRRNCHAGYVNWRDTVFNAETLTRIERLMEELSWLPETEDEVNTRMEIFMNISSRTEEEWEEWWDRAWSQWEQEKNAISISIPPPSKARLPLIQLGALDDEFWTQLAPNAPELPQQLDISAISALSPPSDFSNASVTSSTVSEKLAIPPFPDSNLWLEKEFSLTIRMNDEDLNAWRSDFYETGSLDSLPQVLADRIRKGWWNRLMSRTGTSPATYNKSDSARRVKNKKYKNFF